MSNLFYITDHVVCHKQEAQLSETDEVLDKIFSGILELEKLTEVQGGW